MQTGNGIEINGEKKEYDLTSINNGPNVSTNPDNTTVATEDVNNNVAETQQPVVEQTTPEVSSSETSTPVESVSDNTTTDPVEQASAPVNHEQTPTVQENNNSQAEISAAVNNTVETVSQSVDNATKYVKSNKKLFIVLGIAAVLIILLIIVVIFISSLIKKNEIVGVYACNRSTEGYRNNLGYYSDKFVINNNGTMIWGDFDDTDKENVSGTYTTKKKKYGTKTGYYTEFKLNKSVEKGVASNYSGTITINIFKMKKEGSYDFLFSSGKSYMCEKIDGKKIKTPTTTTSTTTTEPTTTTTTTAVQKSYKKFKASYSLGCESNTDYSDFTSGDTLYFNFLGHHTTGKVTIPEGMTPNDLCKSTEVIIELDEEYDLNNGTTATVYKNEDYYGIASFKEGIE